MLKLDATDRHILRLLQQNANLSTAEIAEAVNLSQPPCWRRIKRLEDEGIITKRVALVDKKKVGLNVVVYVEIKLSANGRQHVGEFEQRIKEFSEVTECYVMLGRIDFLLRVVTKDIESYEQFFREHLSQVAGVQEINSMAALSEVKYTTQVPLNG